MEDMADAFTGRFAGAEGIAEIYHKLMFSADTSGATKAKLLAKMADYLAATTKQYGDRERLAGMSIKHIQERLVKLLVKHNFVVPIPGVSLHGSSTETPTTEAETQEPEGHSGLERSRGESGEPSPEGDIEAARDLDE